MIAAGCVLVQEYEGKYGIKGNRGSGFNYPGDIGYFRISTVMEVERMIEQWSKWEPDNKLPDKVYLKRLIDDKNGVLLEFTSTDETTIIIVSFGESVVSFRNSDEARRLRTIQFLDKTYGKDFYARWSFFKVNKSSYVKWLNQETDDIYAEYNVEHYVFLAADDIVDVLSTYPPNVSVF